MTELQNYLIYLRKSRADSESESVEETLARHEGELQEYALRTLGGIVPERNIYREVVSGESIEDRTEIKKVFQRLQAGGVAGVLVVDPQRLSRGDLEDCGILINRIRYSGAVVHTLIRRFNLSDKYDRKSFEAELMRGADYLEYVKEVLARGRLTSVKRGAYIGSVAPYGYDKTFVDKVSTLTPNPYEAPIVRTIFDMYIREGLGCGVIAKRLDSLGYKPRKSKHWSYITVRDIVDNPVYVGKVRWGARATTVSYNDDGALVEHRPVNPNAQIFDGIHEPLIDAATWDAANIRKGVSARINSGKEARNAFAGLLYCSCGRLMLYRSYKSSTAPRLMCPDQSYCGMKSTTYQRIVVMVSNILRDHIKDFEIALLNGENVLKDDATIISIEKELSTLTSKEKRLYDFLEDGVYTEDQFLERRRVMLERKAALTSSLERERANAARCVSYSDRISSFKSALEALNDDSVPVQQKNMLLKRIIKRIDYSRRTNNRTRWEDTPVSLKVTLV